MEVRVLAAVPPVMVMGCTVAGRSEAEGPQGPEQQRGGREGTWRRARGLSGGRRGQGCSLTGEGGRSWGRGACGATCWAAGVGSGARDCFCP